MVNDHGQKVNMIEAPSNFIEMDNLKLNEMGTMPFFGLWYKGETIKRNSTSLCQETGGDCFAFVTKYLKLEWIEKDYDVVEGE